MTKIRVNKERSFRPFAEHFHAAKMLFAIAEKREKGSALQVQASLVFCAFCVEAYLNHTGAKFLAYWSEVERIPVMSKLRLLLKEFHVDLQFGTEPLQTVIVLFRYRNWMAHSQSATITENTEHEGQVDDAFLYAIPAHEWESFETLENALKCITAVGNLIEAINASSPDPEPLPLKTVTSHTFMTGG